jgi:hypothetical protein
LPEETSKNFQNCKEIVSKSMKNMLIIGEDHPRYFPKEIAQKIINLEKDLIDNFNPDIIFLEGCEYIREDFLLSIRQFVKKGWNYNIELSEASEKLDMEFNDYLNNKFNVVYLDEPFRWISAGLAYENIPLIKNYLSVDEKDPIIKELRSLIGLERRGFQKNFL